jgi:hypothetical protein
MSIGRAVDRIGLSILFALAASKDLRRKWLKGGLVFLAISVALFAGGAIGDSPTHSPSTRNFSQLAAWVGFLGVDAWVGSLLMWVIAHCLRPFGKHVKDDYQRGELFED